MTKTIPAARLRLLGSAQWFGTLVGAGTWAAQHVVGYGIGQAKCVAGGMHWSIGYDTWQLTLTACSGLALSLALAASVYVFLGTRGAGFGDGPPEEDEYGNRVQPGRMHFFAAASILANAIFLGIVLLDGLGSTFSTLCRQS